MRTLFCQKSGTHDGTRNALFIFLKLRRYFCDAKPKKAVPVATHLSLSAVKLTESSETYGRHHCDAGLTGGLTGDRSTTVEKDEEEEKYDGLDLARKTRAEERPLDRELLFLPFLLLLDRYRRRELGRERWSERGGGWGFCVVLGVV